MTDRHLHRHPDHTHVLTGGYSAQRRVGIAALITFTFMFAEVVGGLISGSLALLADAAHMLTDAGSLGLAYVGFLLARRPADPNRTFGFSRFKVLAAFTNGLLLVALAGWIVVEAVQRLASPQPVLSGIMLVVAIAGLLVNLGMFWLLHSGHDQEDLNLRGALLHVMGDLLGSVAAITAAAVIWLTSWTPIDPILSMVVAGILLLSAIPIIRRSAHILLQGTPEGTNLEEIADGLCSALPAIEAVHHIHVWTLTGQDRMITLHVVPRNRNDAISLIPDVRRVLKDTFGIDHATIEMDVDPHEECDMDHTPMGHHHHHH